LIAIVVQAWVIPRYGSVGAAEVMMLCAASGAAVAFAAIYSVWQIAPPAASTLRSAMLTLAGAAAAAAWPASGLVVLMKVGTLCLGVALGLVVSGEFGRPQTVVNRARLAFQRGGALDAVPRVE
jgi:hypothetical protein